MVKQNLLLQQAVNCLPPGIGREDAEALINDFGSLLKSCDQPGYEKCIQGWESKWHRVFQPSPTDEPECRYCDGYGYVRNGNSIEICQCRARGDTTQRTERYMSQLTDEVRAEVVHAHRSRGAIAQANLHWNYKTPAVFLSGINGTGKTIAGHVIIREWITRIKKPARYFSSEVISGRLRAWAMGNEDQQSQAGEWLVTALEDCRLEMIVFLDDLCAERITDASAQFVSDMIRALYERRAHVVFASNAGPAAIEERYGSDILDRLKDEIWCRIVHTGDKSLRGAKGAE